MIVYTLDVKEHSVEVCDGVLTGARLRYIAENFRVYTRGAVPARKFDIVAYHAVSLAIAHHIPAITVKRYIAETRD